MVDGGHLHSQRDGVLVLAVRRAVILRQGGESGKTKDQGQEMKQQASRMCVVQEKEKKWEFYFYR